MLARAAGADPPSLGRSMAPPSPAWNRTSGACSRPTRWRYSLARGRWRPRRWPPRRASRAGFSRGTSASRFFRWIPYLRISPSTTRWLPPCSAPGRDPRPPSSSPTARSSWCSHLPSPPRLRPPGWRPAASSSCALWNSQGPSFSRPRTPPRAWRPMRPRRSEGVLYCAPNWVRQRTLRQDDPLYDCQWHLKNTGQFRGAVPGNDLDVEPVWDSFRGTPSQIVCIVDDGLELAHKDLSPNVVTGLSWDYVEEDPDPTAGSHGTAVGGVSASRGFNHSEEASSPPLRRTGPFRTGRRGSRATPWKARSRSREIPGKVVPSRAAGPSPASANRAAIHCSAASPPGLPLRRPAKRGDARTLSARQARRPSKKSTGEAARQELAVAIGATNRTRAKKAA